MISLGMKKILLSVFAAALLLACSQRSEYDSDSFWYCSDIDTSLVDVFYIYSTDVVASYCDAGWEVPRAVLDSAERAEMTREICYVHSMFGDSLNFISPYYHQFTLNAIDLEKKDFDRVYSAVADEVCEAFDHYIRHRNGGRPFILAGFSQGAMLCLDLLRHMREKEYSRLVAAYIIGYRLSEKDLAHPNIVAATDSTGRGVAVSFNSAMSPDALWPLLSDSAATCINPINWRTDSTPATLSYKDDTAQVSVDTLHNYLQVSGLDPDKYVFAPLEGYAPKGNLHHWDLLFYGDYLRRNALLRSYGR